MLTDFQNYFADRLNAQEVIEANCRVRLSHSITQKTVLKYLAGKIFI